MYKTYFLADVWLTWKGEKYSLLFL